jgi:hypothetical protein
LRTVGMVIVVAMPMMIVVVVMIVLVIHKLRLSCLSGIRTAL